MIIRCAFILCFALAWVVSGHQLAKVNSGIGELSLRLLKTDVKGDENTLHSAYSIVSALGMCLLGAKGETFESMRNTMGLVSLKDDEIKEAFKSSTEQLLQENLFLLKSANRLYVDQTLPLRKSFQKDVHEIFGADAHSVDFKVKGQEVQQEINSFVNNTTEGLIPQILDSPLSPQTRMALVNALYFKGIWIEEMNRVFLEEKFNAHKCDSSQSIVTQQEAKWISVLDRFRYTDSPALEATLVELPYIKTEPSNQEVSMILILPREQHKCDVPGWVKQHLNWSDVVDAINSMKHTNVEVTLPMTKIEAEFELSEVLSDLGMAAAFSNSADFSGMVDPGNEQIKIDKVIHKAKMSIDETGTEAAAATVGTFVTLSGKLLNPPIIPFFVDRSFVAVIILRHSDGSIVPLFTSVVNRI